MLDFFSKNGSNKASTANGYADWWNKQNTGYKDAWGNTYSSREDALAGAENMAFSDVNMEGRDIDTLVAPVGANSTTLGLENSTWGNIGTGLDLAKGLAGALLGYKQLGLMEDQFAFNKDMAEKEYAMAKDAYDRNVKRAESIGEQMRAGGQ